MRWLLFLSRLALICGICVLLSLSLLFYEWTKDQDIASTLITIGFFLGILIIPATLICYLAVIILRKNLTSIVPVWLIVANILCLILFLFYIIFINGPRNYSP